MLTQILFFNTGHFALTVLTTFVFFASGLLYFDSWQLNKAKKTPLIRSIGFFILAVVSALHATSLQIPIVILAAQIAKITGLSLILVSLMKEPVLHKPETKKSELAIFVPLLLPTLSSSLAPLSAVLTLAIAAWYFRKATEGLEKQLMPAGVAFLFLALGEFTNITFIWSDTTNVFWSKMLSQYSLIWNIQHIFELIGVIILGLWVWGYIRFRLQIQLFATTVASILSVFLVTTFFFTFLLLKNLESDALSHLKTDVNVLQYALNRLQLETLSHAKSVAQDSAFNEALTSNNTTNLYKTTSDFLLSQGTNFLTIASTSGEVIMRGEDREKIGDNIAEDPVAKSAISGQPLSTIVINEGINAPIVSVKAATPIKQGGAVVTGFIIDSAFVDGVKDVTGLDVTVFGGDKRAATTFIAPDGKSRFVGTIETDKKVTTTVLEKGEAYVGAASVLNQPYYTAYSPLKTLGDKTIGMLFVGKPQTTLLEAAQKSIDLTFLGCVILMGLSIIPSFYLARFIREQVES